jgi:hypothetical protein
MFLHINNPTNTLKPCANQAQKDLFKSLWKKAPNQRRDFWCEMLGVLPVELLSRVPHPSSAWVGILTVESTAQFFSSVTHALKNRRKLYPEYETAIAGCCCFAIQYETCGGGNSFESFAKKVRTDES